MMELEPWTPARGAIACWACWACCVHSCHGGFAVSEERICCGLSLTIYPSSQLTMTFVPYLSLAGEVRCLSHAREYLFWKGRDTYQFWDGRSQGSKEST